MLTPFLPDAAPSQRCPLPRWPRNAPLGSVLLPRPFGCRFIGGPNTREDYHLDLGSEFFFQMKGNMELPTIQQGKRKLVKINQGHVFLLPSRIPHSPQRQKDTFGLVCERYKRPTAFQQQNTAVEFTPDSLDFPTENSGIACEIRKRAPTEVDGLRWYRDFTNPAEVLWDRYFHCGDLEKDLVPVVKAYKSSAECEDRVPRSNVTPVELRPWEIDSQTIVPDPFDLSGWISSHGAELAKGGVLRLFGENHPDKEFDVRVAGGGVTTEALQPQPETWMYQHTGSAVVRCGEVAVVLEEGCCCVLPAGSTYTVKRAAGSVGLIVSCDPLGNDSLGKLKR